MNIEIKKEIDEYLESVYVIENAYNKGVKNGKKEYLEKLNEWRYKDHNPEEDCQCQKCQYYREIVAMVE